MTKQPKSILKKNQRKLINFVLLVAGALAVIYIFLALIGFDNIEETISGYGIYGPLVYILAKAVAKVFAPLAGSPLYFIAGPLFGFWLGLLYSLIGEMIGTVAAFYISRIFGRKVLRFFLSDDGLKNIDKVLYRLGDWKGLVYVRLIFFGLQDVVNFAAGLTRISFWQFFVVTLPLRVVPLAAAVAVGMALLDKTVMVVSSIVVAIGALVFLVFRQAKGRQRFVG